MKVVAWSENDFNALKIVIFVLAVSVVRLIIVPIDAKEAIFVRISDSLQHLFLVF